MKKKLIFFGFLILIFIIFIITKVFSLNQKNIYGRLTVTSSPSASVFVDNMLLGETPLQEEKYRVGEYLIKLIPKGIATDTASWNGKINIEKNILTYVNIDLGNSDILTAGEIFTMKKSKIPKRGYGEIFVETEPEGAIVYLDNDEKGVSSLVLENVPSGIHELSVFIPGFFKRTQKINLDDGYRLYAKFKLAVDQSQKFITPKANQEATKSAKINEKNTVIIKETPTGWLRVRQEPSLGSSESAKIKVGEKYELLEEKEGWYKIKFNNNKEGLIEGDFNEGWISSSYAQKE